jgi:small GTP-binding protein
MAITPNKVRKAIKILLLGDNKVGKTSIARRYLGQDFSPLYHATIGVNISYIDYTNPQDELITIMFWDLAGTEKFRAMRKTYFEGAHGVFLIWDVSRPETRNDLYHWFEGLEENRLQDLSVAVLANKIDLIDEVTPKKSLADTLRTDLGLWSAIDFQTSARTGENIDQALDWLSHEALFHLKKKRSKLDTIFDPTNYPVILFKLSTAGVEPLFSDKIQLYHESESELEAYLINLGVKISFITGQGQNYNVGISNLVEGEGNRYRLFVYSFKLSDPNAEDPRLRMNYLQFVMFIATQYYGYFPAFKEAESHLENFFSQFNTVDEITYNDLLDIREVILEHFKENVRV